MELKNGTIFTIAIVVALVAFGLYFGMQQNGTGKFVAAFEGGNTTKVTMTVQDFVTKGQVPAQYYIYDNKYGSISTPTNKYANYKKYLLDTPLLQGEITSDKNIVVDLPLGTFNWRIVPLPTEKYMEKLASKTINTIAVPINYKEYAALRFVTLSVDVNDAQTNKPIPDIYVKLTDLTTQKAITKKTSWLGNVSFIKIDNKYIDKTHNFNLDINISKYKPVTIPAEFKNPEMKDHQNVIYKQVIKLEPTIDTTVNVSVVDANGNPMKDIVVKALYSCVNWENCTKDYNYYTIVTYSPDPKYPNYFISINQYDYNAKTDASGKASFILKYKAPAGTEEYVAIQLDEPSYHKRTDTNYWIKKSVSSGKTVDLNYQLTTGLATVNLAYSTDPVAALTTTYDYVIYPVTNKVVGTDIYKIVDTSPSSTYWDSDSTKTKAKIPVYKTPTSVKIKMSGYTYKNNKNIWYEGVSEVLQLKDLGIYDLNITLKPKQ